MVERKKRFSDWFFDKGISIAWASVAFSSITALIIAGIYILAMEWLRGSQLEAVGEGCSEPTIEVQIDGETRYLHTWVCQERDRKEIVMDAEKINHLPAKDPTELAEKHRALNEAFAVLMRLNGDPLIDRDLKALRGIMSRRLDEAYHRRAR